MTDILAQIGTKVGSEIKNLDIRMSSAENAIVNLGGQTPPPTGNFTIEPVNWTNLTEINLSGEKLTNVEFSSVSSQYVADSSLTSGGSGSSPVKIIVLTSVNLGGNAFTAGTILHGVGGGGGGTLQRMEDPNDPRDYPYTTSNQNTGTWDWVYMSDRGTTWEYAKEQTYPTNWSVQSGTLDQAKLSDGIIKGDGGAVSIKQMFSQSIPNGTPLVFKATRTDLGTGNVRFNAIRASDGLALSANIGVNPSDGLATYTTTTAISGVQLNTLDSLPEVSSVSVFQGAVSGGSVQTFTGGSIEKISGVDGYNAGASSVQKIDGQKDGYVQFQIGSSTRSVRVGLVNQDSDFEVDIPFKLNFGGGNIDYYSPFLDNQETYESGDWFRIRHYSTNNEIHFQKRQAVYGDDTDFCLLQTCGLQPNNGHLNNYTFATEDRPLILAKQSANGLTQGEYYRIHQVNTTSGNTQIYTLAGVQVGWMIGRGTDWEVQEELGQDYVTFYTHPTFSNGDDLYFDTSLHSVGSRLNDVQIAYK